MTDRHPFPTTATAALLALLVSAALSPAAAAAAKLTSPPSGGRISIDGDPSDWEGLPIVSLEDSLRLMAVSHDEDNLFLMYRFGDDRLARSLLERGVILWINGDGKTKNKDEAFGVRYTGSEAIVEHLEAVRSEQDAADEERPPRGRGGPRGMAGLAENRPQPGELTVIRYGVKDVIPEGLPGEPNAASAVADGVFCYELRIPIAEIGGKLAGQEPTKRRKVAVGIQIGGTTEAERDTIEAAIEDSLGRGGGPHTGGGDMGGGGPGGMGGMGGGRPGGMGGGGRPGGPPDRNQMKKRLDPEIHWLEIELVPTE